MLMSDAIVMALVHVYISICRLKMAQGVLVGLCPTVVAMLDAAGLSLLIFAFWPACSACKLERIQLDGVAAF